MPDNNKIGYKRPPKATRWEKGQSGNPGGRAKGQRTLKSELSEELAETILIREGGTTKEVSKLRALLKAQTAKAVQGDSKATGLLLSTIIRVLDDSPETTEGPAVSDSDREIIEAFIKRHSVSGEKT